MLEYEHRQFHRAQINLNESTSLFQYYLLLFAFGLTVVIFYKTTDRNNIKEPLLFNDLLLVQLFFRLKLSIFVQKSLYGSK